MKRAGLIVVLGVISGICVAWACACGNTQPQQIITKTVIIREYQEVKPTIPVFNQPHDFTA